MCTEATDNANVNFVKYKEDYYVSTETNYMRRVDPQTLETKEKVSRVTNKKSLWNVTVKGFRAGRQVTVMTKMTMLSI